MMRFNKNISLLARHFGGGKVDPESLIPLNTSPKNDTIDRIHVPYQTEEQNATLYEQVKTRKTFTLYNLFSKLSNSTISSITSSVEDTTAEIRSDSLYLPRLTPNGVPVYESYKAGNVASMYKTVLYIWPLMIAPLAHHPYFTTLMSAITYVSIYRPIISVFVNGLVTKMELVPQTEQILIQKVGAFGCCKTQRVKIDDLEHIDNYEFPNYIAYRFSIGMVDRDMVFRQKSTGEVFYFDSKGFWYQEGLNHELLI